MFFGFSFGMGGIGAAALGELADLTSIGTVYQVCAFLPLLGLLTAFLPQREARYGVARFSRSVRPAYSLRNSPRRCSSGTTHAAEILEHAAGRPSAR